MRKIMLTFFCALFLFSSCSTVGYGCYFVEKEKMATPLVVDANIPNASVYLNGEYVGNTPYTYWGEKADVRKISVKKVGYETSTRRTKRELDSAFLWNFSPFWFYYIIPFSINPCWIWGSFVDMANHEVFSDYRQDFYYFELTRKY